MKSHPELLTKIHAYSTSTPVVRHGIAHTFVAKNSKNSYFRFDVDDILEMLKIIEQKFDHFSALAGPFSEGNWRSLINVHFKNEDIVRTTSGNQTLLYRNLISMFIHATNFPDKPYDEDHFVLTLETLRKTIEVLSHVVAEVNTTPISPTPTEDEPGDRRPLIGSNILYKGPAGTGKSTAAKAYAKSIGAELVCCSLHNGSSNFDFFGSSESIENAERKTILVFRPGPFVDALAFALNNPSSNVVLVIDEINRGDYMNTLGDLFNGLDREPDGRGSQPMRFGNPSIYTYLREHAGYNEKYVYLPSNLTIIGTMNETAEDVAAVDGPFGRRWIEKPFIIDYSKAPKAFVSIPCGKGDCIRMSYPDFLKRANKFLKDKLEASDDLLVGQYYVKNQVLYDRSDEKLPYNLISHFYRVSLRGRNSMFLSRSSSDISQAWNENRRYFCDAFLNILRDENGDQDENED